MTEPKRNPAPRHEGQPPLPDDLKTAIERARTRTASTDMVAQLTKRVLAQSDVVQASPTQCDPTQCAPTQAKTVQLPRRAVGTKRFVRWAWPVAVVAMLLAVVLLDALRPSRDGPLLTGETTVPPRDGPSYSSITKISLVQAGYLRIDQDIDRAEAKLAEVSEGLALANVRREVQMTLDEFYHWSE